MSWSQEALKWRCFIAGGSGLYSESREITLDTLTDNHIPDCVQWNENQINKGEGVTVGREALQKQSLSAWELARLIGKMTATLPAIYQAPGNCSGSRIRPSQAFDRPVSLNQVAQLELEWWAMRMAQVDGKSVIIRDLDLTIETDASLQGWGAVCMGIQTGGSWSRAEQEQHIN